MEPKRYKVAICFFGLTRSLTKTIQSIEQNIFNILIENNIDYDVFLHTYNLDQISNPRSNESKCKLNKDEWKLLNPYKYVITNQDHFDRSFQWNTLTSQGDIWKDRFKSLKNAIRQLNSLKHVTELWENDPPYDYYLYLRPDLEYITPLDIQSILDSINEPKQIIIPFWGNYIGGFNDRIAFGPYSVMKIYGKRIDYLNSIYKTKLSVAIKKPYHSERYLNLILRRHNIHIRYSKIVGIRIRANFKTEPKDFPFLKYRSLIS